MATEEPNAGKCEHKWLLTLGEAETWGKMMTFSSNPRWAQGHETACGKCGQRLKLQWVPIHAIIDEED